MDKSQIKQYIQNNILENKLEEAAQNIMKYKETYDYDDEIASMEAVIEIYKNDYDKAMTCVKNGLKYNLYNSDLYYTLGNIYEAMGKHNNAYLCYEHALTLSTENSDQIIETVHNLRKNYDIHVRNYSIVLLTYNKLEYTKICIDSIRKSNGNEGCEIIVVDNNSTDGTREFLKQQPDIKYILNDYNNGFPGGCNQGIGIADKNNDVFLLNNDTVIMANSIFNLRMGLYSDEKVGASGAVSNSVSNYQMITEKIDNFKEYINFAKKNNITDYKCYEKRIKLVGFAMFMKRDVLDRVGLLDERFAPGNFEDDDLSMRIIMNGYDLILCKDSYIHHFGNISFKDNVEAYKELLKRNSKKFVEKWGFQMEKSAEIRYDVIDLISKERNDSFNVLQIGCGCGATLQMIKNIYPNASLYGTEHNTSALKIASRIADVRCENIENQEFSFGKLSFDYIIICDTIEKMYNPEEVLKKIKKYLKNNGELLGSITNVMNYSIIEGLLSGNWTYSDWGILNRDNIRFFTLNEINKLLKNSGYYIINITGNTNVVNNEQRNIVDKISSISNFKEKEQFEIAQYLVKAKKVVKN